MYGQPNGGVLQNFLAINLETRLYNDRSIDHFGCTICDFDQLTEFSLLGVCDDSFLGKVTYRVSQKKVSLSFCIISWSPVGSEILSWTFDIYQQPFPCRF